MRSDVKKLKTCNAEVNYFVLSDLLNERVDLWQKNKKFSSLKSLYKLKPGDKYNKRPESLAHLIVSITLKLILEDMVNYIYSFKFPDINGGYMGIYAVNNKKFNIKRGHGVVYRPLILNFQRNYIKRTNFKLILDPKYYWLFFKKIRNGVIYPYAYGD